MDVILSQCRGEAGLPQIRQAGEQVQIPVGGEDKGLKHGKAECVIAANPEMAFGGEHDQRIKPCIIHSLSGKGLTRGVFGGVEMKRHGLLSPVGF
jgi:hypothetical protein